MNTSLSLLVLFHGALGLVKKRKGKIYLNTTLYVTNRHYLKHLLKVRLSCVLCFKMRQERGKLLFMSTRRFRLESCLFLDRYLVGKQRHLYFISNESVPIRGSDRPRCTLLRCRKLNIDFRFGLLQLYQNNTESVQSYSS